MLDSKNQKFKVKFIGLIDLINFKKDPNPKNLQGKLTMLFKAVLAEIIVEILERSRELLFLLFHGRDSRDFSSCTIEVGSRLS